MYFVQNENYFLQNNETHFYKVATKGFVHIK